MPTVCWELCILCTVRLGHQRRETLHWSGATGPAVLGARRWPDHHASRTLRLGKERPRPERESHKWGCGPALPGLTCLPGPVDSLKVLL